LLGALGWYLHSGDKEEAMKFFPLPGEELPEKPAQEIITLDKATAAFPPQLRESATHGPRGHRRAIRELYLLTPPARRDAPRRKNPASRGRLPNKTLSTPTNPPLLTYGQMAISPYVAKTQP
jgi:hypothetical protein